MLGIKPNFSCVQGKCIAHCTISLDPAFLIDVFVLLLSFVHSLYMYVCIYICIIIHVSDIWHAIFFSPSSRCLYFSPSFSVSFLATPNGTHSLLRALHSGNHFWFCLGEPYGMSEMEPRSAITRQALLYLLYYCSSL